MFTKYPFVLVLTLFLALFCGNAGGAEFFSEDFNGFTIDDDVTAAGWKLVDENNPDETATWTITNPGGRGNPPTADGTPSDGNFMVSDSDAASGANPTGTGMSHDIWSPGFDCSGALTVILHFDCLAQLNDNGKAVFDVDVSTDDGVTWVNVLRRVATDRTVNEPVVSYDNADSIYGRVNIDISEQAASESNVKIRWRHFEPNDDWWVEIDNVVVDDTLVTGGEFTLLNTQTFSAGIPADWTVRSGIDPANSGINTWNTDDPCNRSGIIAGSTGGSSVNRLDEKFAILDSDCNPDPAEDEYLITSVIDCTNTTEVFLQLKSEIKWATDTTVEILVSTDGGDTFLDLPVYSYTTGALSRNGEEPYYSELVLPVPEAADQSQVVFAFHYQSGGDRWWWAVDDVKVTANGDLNPRTCANLQFTTTFDKTTGEVTGAWEGFAGDDGYRIFIGDVQIGEDLSPDTRTFTDPAPPVAGAAIVYKIQVIVNSEVALECDADPLKTYVCPNDLSCTSDQDAKTVTLTWDNGVNLDTTSTEIYRDRDLVDTIAPDLNSYVDTPPPGRHTYEVKNNSSVCTDALSCRARIAGPNFFFDDFEKYSTDADVEAAGWKIVDENDPIEDSTWTITNPGGRVNPPTFDGKPSEGNFMISDSDTQTHDNGDPGTGMSFDLWSPGIDLSGAATAWLHFDVCAQLNNNGEAVFEVDITTDGGANWTPLLVRSAPGRIGAGLYAEASLDNADGIYGTVNLDITSQAAGQSDVMIRWRHFEPSWDWFIAIDNVLVDDVPANGGSEVLLDKVDFSSGIPGDWTLDSFIAKSLVSWSGDDTCSRSLLNNGGVFPDGADGRQLHRLDEHFAIIDGLCAQADQDELLCTPVIDCTNTLAVYLHVKSETISSQDSIEEILLSVDGGATYDVDNPIFNYNGGGLFDSGEEPFYSDFVFDVPQAVGQANVVFAFRYASGVAGDIFWWAIDDVMVTGEPSIIPELFIRGDINDDGQVNLADPIRLLGYLFNSEKPLSCEDTGDANDDGSLDISDAISILSYLFSGTGPLPAPFPGCGEDTIDDDLAECVYTNCQ